MRRKTVKRLLIAALLLVAPAANAQPMMGGGGGMPNLSQIVGRPLPDRGMPTGTVSVRVARKMPANAVPGAEVSAVIKNAGGDLRRRALKTDESGRILFEGMSPGDEFRAEVNVDGEHLQTQTFTIPPEGGIRTMLISGVAGGGGGAPSGAENEAAEGGGEADGKRAFALGATAGAASEDAALPVGTLEVRLRDESDAPIANHSVLLGMVNKQGEVDVRRGTSDATGLARFTGLPAGKATGYAAVIEWHGLRLNTSPFAMPEVGGARAEIRALARTNDPSVVTIGANARIVVQMSEDRLQILEFLPLENTSDRMFDPSPGALEIPLPTGFNGAQPQENDNRKIDVRPDHGMAVHGPIVPKRSQLGVGDTERTANEVVFGFVLKYYGDSFDYAQPMPNGIGPAMLVTDQKIAGLTASGPGVGAREERVLGGHKYWVMPLAAVPAGGTLKFTLSGLPSTPGGGRIASGVLSMLLIGATIVWGRKSRGRAGGKGSSTADEKTRLIAKREALYGELVSLERTARAAGMPAPAAQREQIVAQLERVYQDIAELDESRAA